MDLMSAVEPGGVAFSQTTGLSFVNLQPIGRLLAESAK
jgi:hypothetical protein